MLPYVPALLSDGRPTHGDGRHMRVEGSFVFAALQGGGNAAAEGLDRVARERLDHARPRDPVADGRPSSPGATALAGS